MTTTAATTPPAFGPGPQPAPSPPDDQAYLRRSPWHRMVDHEQDMLDAKERVDLQATDGRPRPRPSAATAIAEAAKDWSDSISHEFVTRPRRDIFGLALSGGGIRSATFNLGLLQGLHGLGILGIFDYLSTVSGGGYIGAFWSAWMSRDPDKRSGDFPSVGTASRAECPEVEHLRRFSNFLSPRVGLLSYDTGRMIVALVGGMVPALLASLSVIVGAIYLWVIVAQLFFSPGTLVGPAAMFVAGMIVLLASESAWRARGEPARWGRYVVAATTGALLASTAWWWLAQRVGTPFASTAPFGGANGSWLTRLPVVGTPSPSRSLLTLLTPSAAAAAGALVLLLWRVGLSRFSTALAARARTDSAARVASRLFFLATAWIVVSLVWFGGAAAWHFSLDHGGLTLGTLAAAVTALSGAFGKIQHLVGLEPNKATGVSFGSRLKRRLPQILAYLVILVMACSMSLLIVGAVNGHWADGLAIGAVVATVFVLAAFDPNEVGLHSFYRGRLARAYLGASNPVPAHTAEVRDGDDVGVRAMEKERPLQLVCCAANDLDSSDPIATLRRGAVSAVVSPAGFSVGSEAVCWRDTSSEVELPSLATSITASGAAFNSQMGSKSMELGPAVTYLMATFNLRLGLWLPHPAWEGWTSRDWRARARGTWFPGRAFYRELFARSSVTAPRVHLSDGGHFENMALFELLRRHCRYIVASDCGADPDVAFDDFGNLVRRAREDLGVEIDIDLSPLRPGKDGFARQPMVAGDIHYPNGDVGVLLMFKPTLVGNEPVDVRQYHDRNESFPHESTGDQFYDEAQWEAYRRLGVHASRSAFRAVIDSVGAMDTSGSEGGRTRAACIFADARRQWLPSPVEIHDRISRLTSRAAELDEELHARSNDGVRHEVYRELAALAGESPHAPLPSEMTDSLGIVREALLFMEEAFVCEELESRGSHPLYLGLVNYIARWTQSPLVRAWWPLLRPLHAQRFAHYLESRFGLAPRGSQGVLASAKVSDATFSPSDPSALAARSWELERREGDGEGEGAMQGASTDGRSRTRTLSFLVPLATADSTPCDIQVAQVILRQSGRLLAFDAGDFYVAPSFWGAGIGSTFLDRLTRGEKTGDATELMVRIRGAGGGGKGPLALKEGADLTQLYRAAGFREVWPTPDGGWANGSGRISVAGEMRGDQGGGARWLWRKIL